jgi:hypothetical protein
VSTLSEQVYPKAITKERYHKIYNIHELGPNNFGLAVGLCYANTDKPEIVKFGITRDDGEKSWLSVALTMLRNVGEGREASAMKDTWDFEGFLWGSGSSHAWAKVHGFYDSQERKGTLYVLAHEQPKPLVEVISWQEVIERVEKGEAIIEFKHRKNGTLKRAPLTGARLEENLRHIEYVVLDADVLVWTGVGSGATSVEIKKCSSPLVFADGRIQFESEEEIDYTIYQLGHDDIWKRV